MHVVLLGGASTSKVEPVILAEFDYIKVSVYPSIPKFIETANVRTIEVDRFILLQDAISDSKNTLSVLEGFNEYVSKHHPAAKFVFLLSSEATYNQISNIYISPLMIPLLVKTMKLVMLRDIVSQPIDFLKENYGNSSKTSNTSSDFLEELIDPEADKEEARAVLEAQTSKEPVETKKKSGLFGLFKRKENKKGKNKAVESATKSFTPFDMDSPTEKVESKNVTIEGSENNESIQLTSDVSLEAKEEDIDYSVFDMDGTPNFGVGILKTEENDEENINSEDDYSAFEQDDSPKLTVSPDDKEVLEENEDLNDAFVDLEPEQEDVIRLTIHTSEPVLEFDPLTVDTGVGDKVTKLTELKDSVFKRGINLDMSGLERVARTTPALSITNIDDQDPLPDIENLSTDYENQSTKVVERIVEKIVEVPVDRVVEVPVERVVEVQKIVNVGAKAKTYKNGIRTIIVTGDRKTGVTRTAVNMAAHFTKESRTLFVDFDIERKGSLLYFGLENIAREEERVQLGLSNLKNLNVLDNVTYTFPKGGFDCLLSLYGTEFEDGQLLTAQRVLTTQRVYKTIIIDCPLENLHYLEDIILYSEILICVESNSPCVLNTILMLSKLAEDEKFSTLLFNNGQYLLSVDDNITGFKQSLAYIKDIFSLDEGIDWSTLPILGSVTNFEKVLTAI
jgi:hypothetical protein